MRVSIDHVEVQRGALFKKKYHAVNCTVTFTEEEKQIIAEQSLAPYVVMERPPSADMAKQARGIEDVFFLYVRTLLKGTDEYCVETVADAKVYEQALLEHLKELKDYISASTQIEERSKTIEF